VAFGHLAQPTVAPRLKICTLDFLDFAPLFRHFLAYRKFLAHRNFLRKLIYSNRMWAAGSARGKRS
jgi:hypothetical protein